MRIPRKAGAATGILLLVLLGGDAAVLLGGVEHHGGFWNALPLWDLAWGFAGAAGLWLLTKRVLGPLLLRPESWYRKSAGGEH